MTRRLPWQILGAAIGVQVVYPLTQVPASTAVTALTVVSGTLFGVVHAYLTRGPRWTALCFLAIITGSAAIEIIGVGTGWPFGDYRYTGALGPEMAGVPLLVPLAWSMMAYPAWVAGSHVARGRVTRVLVAAWTLAAWDVFLDPQMVAAGSWRWDHPDPALPGVPGVPVGNYVAWLLVGVGLMAAISALCGPGPLDRRADAPVIVFLAWTWVGSMLAHAVFLGLRGSALWGGVAMGLVVVPLVLTGARR